MKQLAVGLISGTSMDGIDACVLEITEERQTHNGSATASHQQLMYIMLPRYKLSSFVPKSLGMMLFLNISNHFNTLTYPQSYIDHSRVAVSVPGSLFQAGHNNL